jgi:hypothetical protein
MAATTAVLAAVPATAATVDFSFTNAAYDGGLVRGTISNLAADATGPGDVVVSFNTGGFGVGTTTACCSLALSSHEGGGLSDVADDVAKAGPVTFTAVSEEPAPIPLPAPVALLAAGLSLLAGIGRRRPRATA